MATDQEQTTPSTESIFISGLDNSVTETEIKGSRY